MRIIPIRLLPGEDLKARIREIVLEKRIQAGFIISAVGSLRQVNLRFAGRIEGISLKNRFEIVSLSGTLCLEGIHLHISIADEDGDVKGGHLLDGSIINTTAEIVIGESLEYTFKRNISSDTGYSELVIEKNYTEEGI